MRWLVGRWWFWLAAVAILFAQPLVRTLFREPPVLPPVGPALPEFSVIQESGAPIARELAGRVWVASFLDPHEEVLPLLQGVQHRLRHMGDSYRLVTFGANSVSELGPLARRVHANPRAWLFASGDTSALAAALKHAPDSLSLHLIDQKGHTRGRFDPRLKSDLDDLVATLGLLVNNY